MTGIRPCASISSSSRTVSGRTPEAAAPRLAILSAIISRAMATGIGSPTPAACDSTMFRCSRSSSVASMRMPASLPKPVLMP